MDVTPLTYSTCQACHARILWVLTVNGRRMPLDAEPVTDGTGNVLIETDAAGRIRGRVLTGAELPHSGPAYVPHHRTCPAADEYRRRADAATPRCQRLDCRQPLDDWLVDRGYTRHIGCLTPPAPTSTIPGRGRRAGAVPVAEQGELFDDFRAAR